MRFSQNIAGWVAVGLFVFGFATPTWSQQDFEGCGFLVEGVSCTLFEVDTGEQYLLEDYGSFQVGDEVFVTGALDPFCFTICLQGDGCIFSNSIEAGCAIGDVFFLRGDVNGDGNLNALVDGLYLLSFGFSMGPPAPCEESADVDNDGSINALIDGVYLLTFGFSSGPPPPPPFPDCGFDTPEFTCVTPAC